MLIETVMFFVQGILEMTGVITFCFAIAKIPIDWVRTAAVATALAILSYAIQSLSFFFGFHTFLLMFLVMLYLFKFGKVSVFKSFLITSITTLILGALEFATNSLLFTFSSINPQDITSDKTLWAIMGIPQAVIIILLAILVMRFFKPVRKGII